GGGRVDGEREALHRAIAGQRQAAELGRRSEERRVGEVGAGREAGAGGQDGDGDGNDGVGIDLGERGGDVERDRGVLVAGGGAGVLIAGRNAVEVEVRRVGDRGDGDADGAAGGGGGGERAAVGGGRVDGEREALHRAIAGQRQAAELGR